MNKPMTLKFRLIAAIIILLGLTIMALSVSFYNKQRTYLIEKNRANLETISNILVTSVSSTLMFDDTQAAQESLQALRSAEYIAYAEIINKNGSSFTHYQNKSYTPIHNKKVLDQLSPSHPYIEFKDTHGLHEYTAIISNGEMLGTFYILDDLSELSTALNRLLYTVGLAALLVSIVSVLIGLQLVSVFTQPLTQMLATITEITRNKDFTKRTPSESIKEFKNMAESFNEMISEIEQRDNRLATLNTELEERVQLRTAELETALQLANQASEAKSSFLAVMSHELRTPLNGIIGFSELLSMSEVSEEVSEQIDLLNQSANNLMELVNEILDFSKLEADKVELEEKNIDAFSFMNSLLDINKLKAQRKNLEIELDIDKNLTNFLGDPLRLRQILNNFIDNAIKFTQQGKVSIKLKQQLHRRQPSVLFEVHDTGKGIDAAHLEHIFSPFSQADNTVTRKYGGTGLGLAICSQLVELMNGTCGVESKLGQGSLFWFRFPLRQNDQLTIDTTTTHSSKHAIKAHDHFSADLLLAEDNETNQKLAKKLFAQFGLIPDIANNGLEAVEMANKKHYDLILMDYHMPEMSGLDAIRIIRTPAEKSLNQATPIVAMTADTQKSINTKLMEVGVDEIFLKPYRFTDLKALLDRWL